MFKGPPIPPPGWRAACDISRNSVPRSGWEGTRIADHGDMVGQCPVKLARSAAHVASRSSPAAKDRTSFCATHLAVSAALERVSTAAKAERHAASPSGRAPQIEFGGEFAGLDLGIGPRLTSNFSGQPPCRAPPAPRAIRPAPRRSAPITRRSPRPRLPDAAARPRTTGKPIAPDQEQQGKDTADHLRAT